MYDYYKSVKEDAFEATKELIEGGYIDLDCYSTPVRLGEKISELLWIDDGVTGNGSGSYTFNSYVAREYIEDNPELAKEAYEEFCCFDNFYEDFYERPEEVDVTIRCYILEQVCYEVAKKVLQEVK